MATTVKLANIETIKARLGINPNGAVQRKLQESCYRHMDKYVPYREGNLRRDVDLSDPTRIVYNSPYARYMYYGKKMVMSNGKSAFYSPDYGFWSKKGEKKTLTEEPLKYHTANTGPYWDRRMMSAEKEEIIKELQDFINRGGK